MPISRTFSTAADADSAAGELIRLGLRKAAIVRVESGGAVELRVDAPLGSAARITHILERGRPGDQGAVKVRILADEDVAPSYGPPVVLVEAPALLSDAFYLPVLTEGGFHFTAMFGLPLLTRGKAALSALIGLPMLAGGAAPLSSMIGLPTLSGHGPSLPITAIWR